MKYEVTVNGQVYEVTLRELAEGETVTTTAPSPSSSQSSSQATGNVLKAPLAGNVLAINVSAGQTVKKGDVVLILEAMKMENEVLAPEDGTVSQVLVSAGQTVESDQVLLAF